MIHELDILDIVSYFLEEKMNVELNKSDLNSIKQNIEKKFASIEVCVSSTSIERFASKYNKFVVINAETLSINMDKDAAAKIQSLRSPYKESKIRQILRTIE